MKKLLAAILAVLYFTATTGASIQLHFCMGRLIGKNLLTTTNKKCSKCGMHKNDRSNSGCCKDELKFFKFDKDQKGTEVPARIQKLSSESIPASKFQSVGDIITSVIHNFPKSNGPPIIPGIPIHKRNCVFLI